MDTRSTQPRGPEATAAATATVPRGQPTDVLGRPLRDLRISVTDRCNFRCTYCMPKEIFGRDYAFLPKDQVLSFEEIHRAASAFAQLGVEKLRITGGEPLVRRGLPELIRMLSELRTSDGRELDLTLTTNGAALRALAQPLADAGLRRVTVSLDSLDDAIFGAMNGIDFPVAKVLDGIDAALEAGLTPVKINMVVRRGINEGSIVAMARWARETGVTLRFIEYMDVGHSNGWRLDEVVPAAELVEMVTSRWPAEPSEPAYRGEVAGRYRYLDSAGEFGIISSVTARSAATARGLGSRPTGSCTRASSRRRPRPAGGAPRRVDRRRAARIPRRHMAGAGRSLFGAAVPVDERPAADRDVRDGWLTGPPRRVPRPSVHRVIHTPPTPVRITWKTPPMNGRMFVDKRVDPSPTRPIP